MVNFLCHLRKLKIILIGIIGPTFGDYYCIIATSFYNSEILYFDSNELFLYAFSML